MTPVEAFYTLLVLMLVANWLCGFAASCAVGVGPDWEQTKRLGKLAPALWDMALDFYERLARRAARLVRRAALWFGGLRNRWFPADRLAAPAIESGVVDSDVSAEVVEAERLARSRVILSDLLAAMSVWNNWSARRRKTAAELDRLSSEPFLDLKSLRHSAEKLRGTMGEGDAEWNSLFERMRAFDDADGHGPLGEVLGKYRRDAKLLGAAAFAAALGSDPKKSDDGRLKIRDVLAKDAQALDRICRTTFVETAKLLAPMKARDAAAFEVADPASSIVEACLWASGSLGPTYSIALLEPVDEVGCPSAEDRSERAELLRAELRDSLGVDEILVRGTEPFVVVISPASTGRALAARLESLRSSWLERQKAGAADESDVFVGKIHASVVASSPDVEVFGAFAKLVDAHDRTWSEDPGRVALTENDLLTILKPRDESAEDAHSPQATAEPNASEASTKLEPVSV